jgi:hypothetical protein
MGRFKRRRTKMYADARTGSHNKTDDIFSAKNKNGLIWGLEGPINF